MSLWHHKWPKASEWTVTKMWYHYSSHYDFHVTVISWFHYQISLTDFCVTHHKATTVHHHLQFVTKRDNDVTVTHGHSDLFPTSRAAMWRIKVFAFVSHTGYGAIKIYMEIILTDKNCREKIIITEIWIKIF